MADTTTLEPNTLFVVVSGSGLPDVDGVFVPSTAPPATSESGTVSGLGYWNGKRAWDRADGKAARSPALSYSNTYKSWRLSRLDGHLAYDISSEEEMPPTDREWNVYKKGVAPAPQVVVHYHDPRQPCPKPNVVFVLGGPGAGKGTMCELDDNPESMKVRFDTFKVEALPIVEFFKSQGKCVDVDTSQDRQAVYALVGNHLAGYTDQRVAATPLTERAEMLLGMRPYPRTR
ncbi:MAG: hypothetical protein KA371_10620 [Acidobacteria bacterium]|nr:hypothetical protein [Acidobacteriota bacterium]